MERTIEVRDTVRACLEHTREVIAQRPEMAFGRQARGAPRHHLVSITVPLAKGASAAQEVELQMGAPLIEADTVRWPVSWRPTAHARFLPSLRGTLTARRGANATTTLVLHARYRPPLTFVGGFGDGVVGHRVARRSTESFLRGVAERVTAEAARRTRSRFTPRPYPPDLRPRPDGLADVPG